MLAIDQTLTLIFILGLAAGLVILTIVIPAVYKYFRKKTAKADLPPVDPHQRRHENLVSALTELLADYAYSENGNVYDWHGLTVDELLTWAKKQAQEPTETAHMSVTYNKIKEQ